MEWKIKIIYSMSIVVCTFLLLSCFPDLSGKRNKMNSEKKASKIQTDNHKEINMSMDYTPIPLPRLIGMADLVVIGEVAKVGDSTFTFQLEEDLSKRHSSNLLTVRKFIPSKFDGPRPSPYVVKQSFVLFLTQPENDNASHPWEILGLTGEGEMPIDNEFVYFEGSFLQGIERKQYEVQGVMRTVQRFNVATFKDAVQHYSECFSWELEEYVKNDKKMERWIASKNCPNTSVEVYQSKSWLHEYLVKETINKIRE